MVENMTEQQMKRSKIFMTGGSARYLDKKFADIASGRTRGFKPIFHDHFDCESMKQDDYVMVWNCSKCAKRNDARKEGDDDEEDEEICRSSSKRSKTTTSSGSDAKSTSERSETEDKKKHGDTEVEKPSGFTVGVSDDITDEEEAAKDEK